MLTIRPDQIALFEQASAPHFNDHLAARLRAAYPGRLASADPATLSAALGQSIAQATRHGLTEQEPVRLFIELMVLLGSGFADDPQLSWAQHALAAGDGAQLDRARRLHSAALAYLDQVFGPDNAQLVIALQQLLAEPPKLATGSRAQFRSTALIRLEQLWPEKFAYLGETTVQQLIHDGIAAAVPYGIKNETGMFVYLSLMFVLGSQFDRDPLLPWISTVLADSGSAAGRTSRLHETAQTHLQAWLDEATSTPLRPLRPQHSAIQGYPYEAPLDDPAVRAALHQAWLESRADSAGERHLEGGYITQLPDGAFQIARWPRGAEASITPLPLDGDGKFGGLTVLGEFRTQPHPARDEQGRKWAQGPQPQDAASIGQEGYLGDSYVIGRNHVWRIPPTAGTEPGEAELHGSREEVLQT